MPKDKDSLKQSKAIARVFLCGGLYTVASCLPGVLPAGAIATLGVLSSKELWGAVSSVLAGNLANAFDNLFSGNSPEPNLLANEDLTKAVGRAIAAIITLVAEDKTNGYNGRTRRHLLDIAKEARDNWVEVARRKVSEADYQELREDRLDEMLTGEGESFTKETALTPEIWLDVFAVLNMAAKAGGGFRLERSVHETVAQQLYASFPKVLRQALKEDFKADGKAFAGLVLSLLTEIKTKVATLELTRAELVAVDGRLGEVIDCLNAGEREQQAFFREIANKEEIDLALAVRDWRFFLNHVPGEPEGGVYRIFTPEWKEVILLWLGRDDVDVARKEEFVRALVEFEDGCGEWNLKGVDKGFYEYRAYFLAAAGINEFRDCSLVEEIVEQIVRWGFGYFDEEMWISYLSSIEEEAREILKETIRDRAIAPLEKLLVTAADEEFRSEIANNLMEIAPGNEKAMAALEEIMANTADEDTRWEIANNLMEIAPGNEKAIALLKQRSTTTTDECIQNTAEILEKIAPGKEKAIATLDELFANTIDEDTSWQTSSTLEQIAFGNEKTIAALAELSATTTDEYTRQLAAKSLEMIGPGNEKAIAALVELLATSTDKDTRCLVAESLGNMAPGNEKAITALVELLATSTSTDYSIRFVTALSLGQIASGNEKAITALVELLPATSDVHTRRQAAQSLGQIASGNEKAIAALEELLAGCANESICSVAAQSLEKIAPGNEKAITALVEQLATTIDRSSPWGTVKTLERILKTNEQYRLAVSNLKYHLGEELNDTNRLLFFSYFVLWHCAQNLPYPEFYRAWHGYNPDDANPTPETFDPQGNVG